jgi:hypothetical protein
VNLEEKEIVAEKNVDEGCSYFGKTTVENL